MTKYESQAKAQLLYEADQNPCVPGEAPRHVWLHQYTWTHRRVCIRERVLREIWLLLQRIGMERAYTRVRKAWVENQSVAVFNNTFMRCACKGRCAQNREKIKYFSFVFLSVESFVFVSLVYCFYIPLWCFTLNYCCLFRFWSTSTTCFVVLLLFFPSTL